MAVVAFLLVLIIAVVSASKCGTIPDCPSFNASAYLGLWYEQSRSGQKLIFEKDCFCSTAYYTPRDSSSINVSNGCDSGKVGGSPFNATGHATLNGPCDLSVYFGSSPVGGPYRVLMTDYVRFTVIASCNVILHAFNKEDIWILSRTPIMDDQLFNTLLGRIKALGFSYDDMYRTPQGEGCVGQGYPTAAKKILF